jgi:hypothetical protein
MGIRNYRGSDLTSLVLPKKNKRTRIRSLHYSDSYPTTVGIIMKSTMLLRALFASAILLVGASSSALDASAAVDVNNYDVELVSTSALFEEWMTTHNKEYVSIEERSLRFMIWLQNHGKYLLYDLYIYICCPHMIL